MERGERVSGIDPVPVPPSQASFSSSSSLAHLGEPRRGVPDRLRPGAVVRDEEESSGGDVEPPDGEQPGPGSPRGGAGYPSPRALAAPLALGAAAAAASVPRGRLPKVISVRPPPNGGYTRRSRPPSPFPKAISLGLNKVDGEAFAARGGGSPRGRAIAPTTRAGGGPAVGPAPPSAPPPRLAISLGQTRSPVQTARLLSPAARIAWWEDEG